MLFHDMNLLKTHNFFHMKFLKTNPTKKSNNRYNFMKVSVPMYSGHENGSWDSTSGVLKCASVYISLHEWEIGNRFSRGGY